MHSVQTPSDVSNNLSLSGSTSYNSDVSTPGVYSNRSNKPFSSPMLQRRFNDSLTSVCSDATAVNESCFLKHKGRNDSSNSTTTLIDVSPERLRLDLPKLSINENQEFTSTHSDFHKGLPTSSVGQQPLTPSFNYPGQGPNPKTRSNSLGYTMSHPSLNKFMTSPSLKTFNDAKKVNQDYYSMIKDLSDTIEFINQNQLSELLNKVEVVDEIKLPNLILLDIRPFTEYISNHLANAVNLCLPSTLLRRTNFSFVRVINSLPTYEKMFFKTYFNFHFKNKDDETILSQLGQISCGASGFPSVLVYGSSPNSVTMYYMVKKLLEQFTSKTLKVYVLDENFNEVMSSFGGFVESGSKRNFSLSDMISNDTNRFKEIPVCEAEGSIKSTLKPSLQALDGTDRIRSHSLNEIPQLHSFASPIESSTPILSSFKLPTPKSATPKFKIRHNEELMNNVDTIGVCLASKYQDSFQNLPQWLNSLSVSETTLVHEFNKLESLEKDRLNQALDMTGSGKIHGAGIEKGYKNRYKDIFIYEDTRVKLNDFGESTPSKVCDYINASYIDSISDTFPVMAGEKSGYFKFIASQGPLKHTVGDFYKMILNNKTKIIISLTNEFENGMAKCEPYWVPGVYTSNDNEIKVSVNGVENINESLLVRNLEIETFVNDQPHKSNVIQFQISDWKDNEICSNMGNLFLVIKLRERLFNDLHMNKFSTVIHCSAGCGRTGTFITVDSFVKLIDLGCPINEDSIFKLVDSLRCQRISMVQNLRQYISIYEMLINYLTNKEDVKLEYDIMKQFSQQSLNDY